MSQNYGTKRIVTGAHYGLRDWLAQRITGVLMALFTVVVIAKVLLADTIDYYSWSGIFSSQWMKTLTFVVIVSLLYHAWVGMRDIWMDYISNSIALRLAFHAATILWLVGCAGWAAQIIWRA